MRPVAVALALVLIGCGTAEEPRFQSTEITPPENAICRAVQFDAAPFVVCEVPRDADIALRLNGADGQPLGDFESLRAALPEPPVMAMNAGMYHADRRAVGLYIEDGAETAALQTRESPGNFGLLPNGVFWSDGTQVFVTETLAFAARRDTDDDDEEDEDEDEPVTVDFATQSGPMLVIDGALHPKFLKDSESRKRRNGVGVSERSVYFAISDAPVNFHHFARLFRDHLGAENALFLDGTISRISAPELGREERGGPLGPMVAILPPLDDDQKGEDAP